jgi:hypothetical protein
MKIRSTVFKNLTLTSVFVIFCLQCYFIFWKKFDREDPSKVLVSFVEKAKESQMIFIGGYARSGTTLMRAILDVHDSVCCGNDISPKNTLRLTPNSFFGLRFIFSCRLKWPNF